jgi:hypothetical protein
MKSTVILMLISLMMAIQESLAQSESINDYRNFPIVLSLQFHSLAMPFKDFRSNFKNVGIGIGTEVSLNGSRDWVQQFDFVWIKNKGIGNALHISSQAAWRPMIGADVFTEVKLGLGYMLAKHPSPALIQKDGQWTSKGEKGKGMLTVPVGLGMGYYRYSEDWFVSPFLGYQLLLVSNYNQTLPIVPQTLIQTGLRIHPTY